MHSSKILFMQNLYQSEGVMASHVAEHRQWKRHDMMVLCHRKKVPCHNVYSINSSSGHKINSYKYSGEDK